MRQEGRKKIFPLNFQEISRGWWWGIFCFSVLALVTVGILIGYWLCGRYGSCQKTAVPADISQQTTSTPEIFYRPLDGAAVENLTSTMGHPMAVMIDNMIDARPQYGLNQASLVIEAPAEAQITRFLAIFDSTQNVTSIGPVRSARPYFAEWAAELGALYVHSGGSPEALDNLKKGKYDVFDLNEFYAGNYFWRSKQKYAPHNLLTSSDKLNQALVAKLPAVGASASAAAAGTSGGAAAASGAVSAPLASPFPSWQFKDGQAIMGATSSLAVKISYNQSDHLVVWKYNAATNRYERYQGGKPHTDAVGEAVSASNVAVQWVKMSVLDAVGRKKIITTGEGEAWIFQDGIKIEGSWRKEVGGRTRFFDAGDQEIKFNRGTTWIEVVADGIKVE